MSEENLERLKEFKEWIEDGEREHRDILGTDHEIGLPLHQAADAARRRFKQISQDFPQKD